MAENLGERVAPLTVSEESLAFVETVLAEDVVPEEDGAEEV